MLGGGGHFGVAHAGLHRRERRLHGAVLHKGRAADELHLLGALDDFNSVDHFAGVDKMRAGEMPFDVIHHRVGHLIGADESNRPLGVRLERLGGELRIVVLGVMRRGIARCGQDALDAAPRVAAMRRDLVAAERPLRHYRHIVVTRKDHRIGIAVGRGHVGEVFDVAAHVIVVVLHEQDVDLVARHGGAHGLPAALKLSG